MRRFVILVLAALGLYIAFRAGLSLRSVSQAELWSQALWQQVKRGPGAVADFTRVGPSDWERVFIFHPYTPAEYIDKALGLHWPDAEHTSIAFDDTVNLVVFVRGGKVVGWFVHGRNRGDLVDVANGAGYSRDEAWFLVAQDREQRLVCRAPR